jgi:AraC-like DNA-binding protein
MSSVSSPPPLSYASALRAWLLAARDTAQRHGVDADALLKKVGLDLGHEPGQEADPMSRHPAHLGLAFWQEAMRASGEELLGMDVALNFLPLNFNALGYALMASENLGEMYLRLARFAHIVSDAADLRFTRGEGASCLTLTGDSALLSSVDDVTRWSIFDYAVLTIIRGSRMLYGRDFMPLELRLQRRRPAEHHRLERVLRCVPVYGCADNAIVVDNAMLDKALSFANLAVVRASEDTLERYSAQWASQDPSAQLQAQLAKLFKDALPSGEPRQDDVATRLGLSLRSLQRRLAEQGSSYRDVLNQTRHSLALDHLAQAELSVGEIAFLLGFSEVSAFTRAFKRWTGVSPREWRNQGDGGPADVTGSADSADPADPADMDEA